MKVEETVQLTDREAELLHAIERSIVYWDKEVVDRNYAGRDENERDICVQAAGQFYELRDLLCPHSG